MMRSVTTAALLALLVVAAATKAQQPDDCDLKSPATHSRDAVKRRTRADGAHYTEHNGGKAMSVEQWFQFVCSHDFNAQVPRIVDDSPTAKLIPRVESIRVKLRGYVLAVRFEKRTDLDLHAELGAIRSWNTDHVLVEVPAGKEYCQARKALWSIVENDPAKLNHYTKRLANPVPIEVEGYVFLDYSRKHRRACKGRSSINWCDGNAGRGIHRTKQTGSLVRGCWEVHPVLSVKSFAPASAR